MKNIFIFIIGFVVLSMSNVMPVMASEVQGSSCQNPIPLTKDMVFDVTEPGTYWFSSWTYDLPLKVRYTPSVPTNEKIKVYVDFSCTTGVYDDPKLVELTDIANGWGIQMPIPFNPIERLIDGKTVYEISVSESHRELMTQFGISYDVQAKVEVIIPVSGVVEMLPDTVFRTCVENSHWVELPDTVEVSPISFNDTYVLSLADWQNDSIRFSWMGTQHPVSIWMGKGCEFTLDETDSLYACKYEIQAGEYLDFTPADLKVLQQYGPFLYAKIVSSENASLVFDYKPLSPEMARAVKMNLDVPVNVEAKDVDQYYYFDKELSDYSLQFTSSLNDTIIAHFGLTPTFALDDPYYVASYVMYPNGNGAELALSKKEMAALAKNVLSDHLFVLFDAPKNTDMTLSVWDASTCIDVSSEIFPAGETTIAANSSSVIYRIDYEKWKKGDVELYWGGARVMYVYLADTCSFTLSNTNEHVLNYQSLNAKSSFVITKENMDSYADRVDADGYLYFRFNTRNKGTLTTTFTLDSAYIPVVPTNPCVANSIELKANDQLTLNLDSAFTVYRINYNDWVTIGATLTWKGTEPLHTFVAETCEFAVAPYNKYVHVYEAVVAGGSVVLDAAKLATLAEYVDEDGYLYIRFLTEKEGILEVK